MVVNVLICVVIRKKYDKSDLPYFSSHKNQVKISQYSFVKKKFDIINRACTGTEYHRHDKNNYVRDGAHDDDVHGDGVRADGRYFHNFHSPHADHLRDHAHSSNIHLHTPPLAFQEIQLRL